MRSGVRARTAGPIEDPLVAVRLARAVSNVASEPRAESLSVFGHEPPPERPLSRFGLNCRLGVRCFPTKLQLLPNSAFSFRMANGVALPESCDRSATKPMGLDPMPSRRFRGHTSTLPILERDERSSSVEPSSALVFQFFLGERVDVLSVGGEFRRLEVAESIDEIEVNESIASGSRSIARTSGVESSNTLLEFGEVLALQRVSEVSFRGVVLSRLKLSLSIEIECGVVSHLVTPDGSTVSSV